MGRNAWFKCHAVKHIMSWTTGIGVETNEPPPCCPLLLCKQCIKYCIEYCKRGLESNLGHPSTASHWRRESWRCGGLWAAHIAQPHDQHQLLWDCILVGCGTDFCFKLHQYLMGLTPVHVVPEVHTASIDTNVSVFYGRSKCILSISATQNTLLQPQALYVSHFPNMRWLNG